MHIQVNPGYPDVTEQDPSPPCEILISEESESLAEFVLELWAQHRRIATARSFIKKKWTDSLELVELNVRTHRQLSRSLALPKEDFES